MYNYIINPGTKKKYSINSRYGINILRNHINELYKLQLGGGSSGLQNFADKNYSEILKYWKDPSTKPDVIEYFSNLSEDEVLYKIEENGHFLQFMTKDDQDDENLVENSYDTTGGSTLQWASPRLKKDDSIVNQALNLDVYNIKYADKTKYRDNTIFMQDLMERNYQSLQFATKKVQLELNYNRDLEHADYLDQKTLSDFEDYEL